MKGAFSRRQGTYFGMAALVVVVVVVVFFFN